MKSIICLSLILLVQACAATGSDDGNPEPYGPKGYYDSVFDSTDMTKVEVINAIQGHMASNYTKGTKVIDVIDPANGVYVTTLRLSSKGFTSPSRPIRHLTSTMQVDAKEGRYRIRHSNIDRMTFITAANVRDFLDTRNTEIHQAVLAWKADKDF